MRFPHTTNGHRTQRCPECGAPLVRNLIGRRKEYCSDQCRLDAYRTRRVGWPFKIDARYPYEGLQRNDSKSACGTGANFQKNSGRPPDIQAPRHVIEGEIGGRGWIEIISTDGVQSFMRSIGKGISARDAAP
jgi:hypothetical protein